jgi:uncharacterized protein YndB with AHSA1/START domain
MASAPTQTALHAALHTTPPTAGSTFVYVTFIRTTPERLWEALTSPEFTRQYWYGIRHETDWTPGSPWRMVRENGLVTDSGEVLEADPPRRLVLKWRNEFIPEMNAEGYGQCVMEIEPLDNACKLTITHTSEHENSKLIRGVSGGWPRILSNLKSLLETGEIVLPAK